MVRHSFRVGCQGKIFDPTGPTGPKNSDLKGRFQIRGLSGRSFISSWHSGDLDWTRFEAFEVPALDVALWPVTPFLHLAVAERPKLIGTERPKC